MSLRKVSVKIEGQYSSAEPTIRRVSSKEIKENS